MKAYVAKNTSGCVTKGWLLRQGFSIDSPVCRLALNGPQEKLEEVPVEHAVRSAAREGSIVGPTRSTVGRVETTD